MTSLLDRTELTARFKAGKSALGHHWELFDVDESQVGRTKRDYDGGTGKRQLMRLVTATGMDSGNDIHARVFGADDKEVVALWSRNVTRRDERDPSVEVASPDGTLIGVAHHPDEGGVRFTDAHGSLVANIPVVDRDVAPWELLDADGQRIGLIDRVAAKPVAGPSLLDYVAGINSVTDNASDFAATMFRGFAFSNLYSVALGDLPASDPLRTLAVLSPVILGHLY